MKLARSMVTTAATFALLCAACAQKPELVAKNDCHNAKTCSGTAQPLRQIDKVDILLVVDNSDSMVSKAAQLKMELPRLLNAIVSGQAEDMTFPPASSVHVAVTTSDMGIGSVQGIDGCSGVGNDGLFIEPGKTGVTCDTHYPGYLAFEGGPAALATVDSVSCVPLGVLGTDPSDFGCGFEQPLEAGLKAIVPKSDHDVTFAAGDGHGADENAGFLRQDSLLVVVVVSDEDDCSTADDEIFTPPSGLDANDPLYTQGLNMRCALNSDRLYKTGRYVDGLKALRPHNENVIFAAVAGIPADLLSGQDAPDFDAILADKRMQNTEDDRGTPSSPEDDSLKPSCTMADGQSMPPRRLVEVAKGFGDDGVLGSLCADDFGAATGRIIRAIGTRLVEYSNGPDASVPAPDHDAGQ
jgi:hypothetical protein